MDNNMNGRIKKRKKKLKMKDYLLPSQHHEWTCSLKASGIQGHSDTHSDVFKMSQLTSIYTR